MTETDGDSEAAIPDDPLWDRETAPQSSYTMRQVGTGLLVFVIGVAITFGIALVLG